MRKNIMLLVFVLVFGLACGSSSTTSTSSGGDGESGGGETGGGETGGGTAQTGLQLTTAADFSASASAVGSIAAMVAKTTTGQCSDLADPTMDDPSLADGLDCDGDGGVAAHVTPTEYALAFRSATLISSDGVAAHDIVLLADTGTLANSEVVDFTEDASTESIVTVDPADLEAGAFAGIELKLYYFQMTFPVAGVAQNVRTYMSDDDFPAEGNLGHHQGDITFIDANGVELGWVDDTWLMSNLDTTRGDAQNGSGGVDSETGHDRGFFGNTDLWNGAAQMQGANQDVYVMYMPFDNVLDIPDPATISDLTVITVTFSVADTFYYEDFAPKNTAEYPGFYPAAGGEAASENGSWAPLTPTATVSVE